MALPAMDFLRSDYTEVWVPGVVLPLLQFADHTRSIAATHLDMLGIPGLEPEERLQRTLASFDSIMSWYGTNRSEFREAVKKVTDRAQFFPALPADGETGHCADFFARQVGAPVPAMPRILITTSHAQGNHVVIHPFSGSARKNWPLARYRELAQQLPLPVRWCAGAEEELAEAVRFDNLLELATWIASARVYIGNDSGITHLAAAAGVPVVAIFGPTDPAVWAPRGEQVRVLHGKLEEISISEVHDAICSLL